MSSNKVKMYFWKFCLSPAQVADVYRVDNAMSCTMQEDKLDGHNHLSQICNLFFFLSLRKDVTRFLTLFNI